uniref:Uncharacterized protein n=1 Tax=Rhizophora mucronata TaxID=61149 RepID=A0A2P2PKX0_RHIMU
MLYAVMFSQRHLRPCNSLELLTFSNKKTVHKPSENDCYSAKLPEIRRQRSKTTSNTLKRTKSS